MVAWFGGKGARIAGGVWGAGDADVACVAVWAALAQQNVPAMHAILTSYASEQLSCATLTYKAHLQLPRARLASAQQGIGQGDSV